MTRTRLSLLTLLAALALTAAVASSAQAALVKARGQTTVTLSDSVTRALSANRVSIATLSPATGKGPAYAFPIVAGFRDGSYNGIFVHDGGLRLRKGGASAWLRRLVAVRLGGGSVLLAQVRGSRRECRELAAAQRRLAPGAPSAARGTLKAADRVCREGRVIVLAKLSKREKSVTGATAQLSANLKLTREGAELFNAVAGKRILRPGATLGSATSTVCETSPCVPQAAGTTLGILFPTIVNAVGAKEIVTEARALGVRTVRTSQNVSTSSEIRPAILTYQREGMSVQLGLNNDPQRDASGNRPSRPPVGADELATYKRRVASIFDRIAAPVLVNIENEENAANFFSGTMDQYLAELEAAVEVAHARGIKVTNGGITSNPAALLTWQDYKDRGMDAQADDFASRAFSDPGDAWILRDLRRQPFTGLSRQVLQTAWDKAKQLVPGFRRSKMDYVNFHWYIDDDRALAETVAYLRRATGKPVITTEIGQYNTDPAVVTGHLRTLVDELRLPFVIWFDADGMPALGLHDAPGVLRPNGQAFRSFATSSPNLVK